MKRRGSRVGPETVFAAAVVVVAVAVLPVSTCRGAKQQRPAR